MKKRLIPTLMAGLFLPSLMAAKQKPNIIYIMTDQQSAIALGAVGNKDVATPNMDRLADRGVRFENAYCAFPLSGPSRSCMFTGYTPGQAGLRVNGTPLPDSLRTATLGQLVADAGYETAYAGKWHVNTNSLPDTVAFGFRRIHGHGDFGLADAAVEFLQKKHGQPFFLVASFDNPHNICQYARHQNLPWADLDEPDINDCPGLPANHAVAPYDADVLAYEKQLSYRLYPTQNFTDDDWRRYRNAYYRLVETVDAEIGKIVDEIDRQNLWDNTVVIFSSDHGDGMGAHQWNQKSALYDEVTCVPLIVTLPGGKNAGKVLPQLINNGEDLMPTICDWAGADMPAGRMGRSYRAVVEKGSADEPFRDFVVTETLFDQTAGTQGWSVRTPKYKYVLYDTGKNREMLYDMESDRGEMQNLAVEKRYADELQRHRDMLRQWMTTHPQDGKKSPFNVIPR